MRNLFVLVGFLALAGCGGQPRVGGPYSGIDPVASRDVPRAEALYQQARTIREQDPQQAQDLLRQALTADLYHGPAHNDLGVFLLQAGQVYEAAFEFTWARKLMPGHPDPRVNLAIALEAGGKPGEAIEAARAALDLRPEYLPAIQTITFIQIRNHLSDERTPTQLALIAERAEDPAWRNWAQDRQGR